MFRAESSFTQPYRLPYANPRSFLTRSGIFVHLQEPAPEIVFRMWRMTDYVRHHSIARLEIVPFVLVLAYVRKARNRKIEVVILPLLRSDKYRPRQGLDRAL